MSVVAIAPWQRAERDELALSCVEEIESISVHLRSNLPNEPEYLFLRSMVLHVIELNSVAMSVSEHRDQSTNEPK